MRHDALNQLSRIFLIILFVSLAAMAWIIAQAMGFGGNGMPSADAMKELAAKMPGGIPQGNSQGAPSLPKDFPNLPGTGLPGLGKPTLPGLGKPGLGGFPGIGKKK